MGKESKYKRKPMHNGDRFNHPIDGWYEVINAGSVKSEIRFDNTGYTCVRANQVIRTKQVFDKLGVRKHQVGERFQNNNGDWFTITKLISTRVCEITFDDTNTKIDVCLSHAIRGNVKDFNKPTIYGVGYMGFKRGTTDNDKECYRAWYNMMSRCYNKDFLKRRNTYEDCIVSKEWHCYKNFKEWHDANYIENWCLDKDILYKGNKIYSPNTCCFVPNDINVIFTKRQKHRGIYPIGVSYCKRDNRFSARIYNINGNYTSKNFPTAEDAFMAYKQAKEAHIKEVANKWKDKIAANVYDAMMRYEVEITD